MLNEGNQTQLYTVSTFVILFYFGSGTVSITVPLSQKVTAPMVPAPQYCFQGSEKLNDFCFLWSSTVSTFVIPFYYGSGTIKEIKYKCIYCVNFVIPFYYGSGTVINYGSGSAKSKSNGSCGSGSPQRCFQENEKLKCFFVCYRRSSRRRMC
jgi:hypothetical protein